MDNKEIRKNLQAAVVGLPNREISPGVYVKTVGYKYLTIVDIWVHLKTEKIPLEYFNSVSIEEGIANYRYENNK